MIAITKAAFYAGNLSSVSTRNAIMMLKRKGVP
jgi:hypothetical protein